jgi:alkylation response protein AidB-like acyl-CoA dehydrogenase
MIFNMHCGVARNIVNYGPDETRMRFLPAVARGEVLFCSIRNEPNASATQGYKGGLQESLTPLPEGGYRYTCRKFFATGSSEADYMAAYGRLVGSAPGEAEQWVLIPRDDPGVEVIENWDTLGMRATRSNYVNFTDCYVAPDAVISEPGLPIFGDLVVVGQGVVSLAIGESAVDFAVRYLRGEIDEQGVNLADDPHAQREIGELELLLDSARLVFHQACRAIDQGEHERDRAPEVHRAWYHARIVGADVPQRVLALVGGRGTYRRFPLERHLRDGETIALMGPSRASLASGIGKARLGPGPHFESLWLE